MTLAWISVAALLIAVAVSCTTAINVGILSMSMALLVGVYLGGMTVGQVLQGFPTPLFVTLVGITLLFSIADVNGTLSRVTAKAVSACRGQRGLLPIMFFVIGIVIATIGAGATPASALLAPPAMAVAARAGIPLLLMAIMAGNGALAGTLSPFAPTGIVANGVMDRIGLSGVEWQTFAYNALAHTTVGFVGFLALGGWRLFKKSDVVAAAEPDAGVMESRHWLTLTGIIILIVAVAGLAVDVGMAALVIATMLILLRTVEEQKAIQRMPWGVILMVTGVTVLIAMLEKTKGLELIASGIANVSTPSTIAPVAAFGTGVISVYSSTSGVVLPAFLPTVPGLVMRLAGADPLAVATSMNIGAHLVDMSPLSTTGALCLAAMPAGPDVRKTYNKLLAWGLSMSIVGALGCYLLL